jgi:hypothetical protein
MTAGPDDRRAAVDERVADMRALSGREVVPLIHWYQQRCAGQRCLPDP